MDVHIRDGRIFELVPAPLARAGAPAEGDTTIGVGDGWPWIAPGLVDLQVNGYRGVDVNDDALTVDQVASLVHSEWQQGVTSVCPTLVSAEEEKIVNALSTIAAARHSDPLLRWAIPGVHVEGPYLSPEDGPRGAHDAGALRAPDIAELERWQRAAGGCVGLVTVAPELPGAIEYVRAATAMGVVVGLGHTGASPEDVRAAVDAGARLSTHLGNGCHVMLHRHRNPIWAQLADDRLVATYIADGHHLPAEAFRSMVRAKGVDRAVLVSDSVALAGFPPGHYRTWVGGSVELSPDRRLSITGTRGQLLAGSVSSLSECLAWAVSRGGLSLPEGVRMASTNAWHALATGGLCRGRPPREGVEAGSSADLSIFTFDADAGELSMQQTIVRGEAVSSAAGPRGGVDPSRDERGAPS